MGPKPRRWIAAERVGEPHSSRIDARASRRAGDDFDGQRLAALNDPFEQDAIDVHKPALGLEPWNLELVDRRVSDHRAGNCDSQRDRQRR